MVDIAGGRGSMVARVGSLAVDQDSCDQVALPYLVVSTFAIVSGQVIQRSANSIVLVYTN